MSTVDDALYLDGRRSDPSGPSTAGGGFRWIGLLRPSREELAEVAREFRLHPLAVEDAAEAHQRPKMERYGDTLFVVLRPARYVDPVEVVEIGEVHLFLGPDFAIVVRHADEPALSEVRRRLESDPELLRGGPDAVLYGVLDRVVDDYAPVLAGLRTDIDQIETQVFDGDPEVSRRIYQLTREVIEFQRAVEPLGQVLDQLGRRLLGHGPGAPGTPDEHASHTTRELELARLVRDVADHATEVRERVEGFRQLLGNILTVNATLVAQRQNDEMTRLNEAGINQSEQSKRISSIAAILFTPTLVSSIYGMNFQHMPELAWTWGYPFAMALMLVLMLVLYLVFKARGWL